MLAILPLALQSAGLACLAFAPGPLAAASCVAVMGLGAGLHTLARPWLVQRLYGVAEAGFWNGQVARAQGFGRALGPVLAVALADRTSVPFVLLAASACLLALVPVAQWLVREREAVPEPAPLVEETS